MENSEEENPFAAGTRYVSNYLLNFTNQGETFHVINMSWFSVKAHHKFRNCNICSSFFFLSINETVKVLFSTCQINIFN